MQRYDDRDYARRPFEDDDPARTGRYADDNRPRWGRGVWGSDERFDEGRYESFGQSGSGRYDRQEPERGRYGSQYNRGYGPSGSGYGRGDHDRERYVDQDEKRGYASGSGRGEFGRSGAFGRSGRYQDDDRYGSQYVRGGQWGPGGYERGGYSQEPAFAQPFLRYTEIWMVQGPHTGRGPRGYRRSDERIREDVCERLTQHGQIDASDLEVDVHDGEVTLRGTADSGQTRRMAEETIEGVPGVRDVTNQIRVRQGTGGEHRGSYSSSGTGMSAPGAASSNRQQLRQDMDVHSTTTAMPAHRQLLPADGDYSID